MKKIIWLICFFFIAHLAAGIAIAQVPSTISYQGILTGSDGQLIENGSYDMHFRLYSDTSTSTAIWEEFQSVSVHNGLFSVQLGSNNPLDLPFDQPYYLGLTVGEAPELSPRLALTSSAYSLRARSVTDGNVALELPFAGTVSVNDFNPAFSIKNSNASGGVAIKAESGNFGMMLAASHVGMQINTGGTSILIDRAGGQGTYGGHGIWIRDAYGEGFRVDKAGGYGIYATGNQGAGYFKGSVDVDGYLKITADSSNPDANLHLKTGNWIQTEFENTDSDDIRGYIGLDWRALTLSNNAYWTGTEWEYPATDEAAFALLFHRTNQRMEFRTRPADGLLTTAMVINADQSVGIGTTNTSTFRLAVNGDAAKPGGGSWSVFSDQRLKRDIRNLEPGVLDRLLSVNGYTFEYLDEAIENRLALPGRQTGLIAQEVLDVFPDWVDTDDEGYMYVTERGLTAMLIEALRELKNEKDNEISALHQRIQHLELYLLQISSAE